MDGRIQYRDIRCSKNMFRDLKVFYDTTDLAESIDGNVLKVDYKLWICIRFIRFRPLNLCNR